MKGQTSIYRLPRVAGEGTRETGSLDDEGRCSRLSLINGQTNFRVCGSRLLFRVPSLAKADEGDAVSTSKKQTPRR